MMGLPKRLGTLFAVVIVAGSVLPVSGASVAGPRPVTRPSAWVNPMVGTTNGGNTTPAASVPFGMMQFGPDTPKSSAASPGYSGTAKKIQGFSTTALSGAGCPDFHDFPLMPYVGSVSKSPATSPSTYHSTFDKATEDAKAGYYGVRLDQPRTKVETTVARRAGLARVTFPASKQASLLINPNPGSAPFPGHGEVGGPVDASFKVIDDHTVQASEVGPGFCMTDTSYKIYVTMTFDKPFTAHGTWSDSTVSAGSDSTSGAKSGAYVVFDTTEDRAVTAKVAVSYVDMAGSEKNLAGDAPTFDFDAMRARASAAWDRKLSRISVAGGTRGRLATFYTALYHAMIHPSTFSDVDGRYIGYDDRIHRADGWTQYANFSGWDVYRAWAALISVIDPAVARDVVKSLVVDGEQCGAMPRWGVANDESAIGSGDPASATVATAHAFGVRGFDTRSALELMRKSALKPGTKCNKYLARPGLAAEQSLGYVPIGDTDPVSVPVASLDGVASRTLEYATANAAIARYATALGDTERVAALVKDAQNWQRLFNPKTGFIEPRNADGTFQAGFDPTAGTDFTEGNAYTYTWSVPQNLSGLVAALGGRSAATARLDAYLADVDGAANSPNAAMSNEPSLGATALYNWTGHPAKAQEASRRAEALYSNTPGGLPGNDDLGTLSAWYVWNAIGLYPQIPGVGGLTVTSPLFENVEIALAGGRTIEISAPDASTATPYVQSAQLNRRSLERTWLAWNDLKNGASLDFHLGNKPTNWAAGYTPPSMSTGQAPGIGFVTSDAVSVKAGEKPGPLGGGATFAVGVQNVTETDLDVTIRGAGIPKGVTVSPTTGTLHIPAGQRRELTMLVSASSTAAAGTRAMKPVVTTSNGRPISTESVKITVTK